MSIQISQHNKEIALNKSRFDQKPILGVIYDQLYNTLKSRLTRSTDGVIMEIGSGMGNVKRVIPECITTDIFDNPWLDRVESAYHLSFKDQSVSNIVMLDVWHHLQYPGAALAEFHRVLSKGGHVLICDPAMSLLGLVVYGLLHHEPLGLRNHIEWYPPAGIDTKNAPYFAAQAYASRIFGWTPARAKKIEGWKIVEVRPFSYLGYFLSGGYSKPQLIPICMLPTLSLMDRWADMFPRIMASRVIIVLEKI